MIMSAICRKQSFLDREIKTYLKKSRNCKCLDDLSFLLLLRLQKRITKGENWIGMVLQIWHANQYSLFITLITT